MPPARGQEARSDAERRAARGHASSEVLRLASNPAIQHAIGALQARRLADAERIVRQHLSRSPRDVAALCLLGDLAVRAGVLSEAETLFRRALEQLPMFAEAQVNLARVLSQRDALPEAIGLLDDVLHDQPEHRHLQLLRLAWLGQLGDYETARDTYPELLERSPDWPEGWTAYAHLLGTLGDLPGAVTAYRRAIALAPHHGEAWWGLANLKVKVFEAADVEQLRALTNETGLDGERRSLLHFALAKALQDSRDYDSSYRHYVAANRLRKVLLPAPVDPIRAEVDRSICFFTAERFETASRAEESSSGPIFIVGMPRSGSTLVEQILASHSLVEGTSELPYIPMLVHRLMSERRGEGALRFPEVLDGVPTEKLAELGQAYLDAARPHRRSDTPFFIDKLPDNWRYVGLIRMILPGARIVDARRGAMACLWSNYRQWFARGQEYSYDFDDLVEQYRQYLRLMAHMDAVAPGAVITVQHEDVLDDSEREVRRLLARLGLPFEPSCLEFYRNNRPVRTASAQQVRRPIDQSTREDWKNFRPWIGELEDKVASLTNVRR
ncbi:sulfotransferase [Sphingomonas sp. KRR8]|uniref:tetratricopeptide repeat-containing sulfotransferase family protein n=1 Tax=Sphingomonas sp. KRR8 TaxID=2942996 RepID=UPI0020212EF6|nr:sulfotransferase [Sphingomonas sp. KRR8]URD61862.1 sulfotransferase [Sphingomonas sp. KRR8]